MTRRNVVFYVSTGAAALAAALALRTACAPRGEGGPTDAEKAAVLAAARERAGGEVEPLSWGRWEIHWPGPGDRPSLNPAGPVPEVIVRLRCRRAGADYDALFFLAGGKVFGSRPNQAGERWREWLDRNMVVTSS